MRRETRPVLLVGLLLTMAASGCGGGGEPTGPVTTTPSASGPLPGGATAPAAGAIPQQSYVPRAQDFSTSHPQMPGVQISFNTITVVLQPAVTVGEANALLESQGATIVGGFPGKAGTTSGILVLRLPTTSHDELIARLTTLRADARVLHVVQDAMLAPAVVTSMSFAVGPPDDWTWFLAPGGDNWGLEMIRVPQMWNLNDAIRKAGGAGVATLVLDVGFQFVHPDLTYLTQSAFEHEHGTHVAGIIGATFDNNLGVDGVNPFARMLARTGAGPDATWAELLVSVVGPLLRATTGPPIRVINSSLGFNWGKQGINPAANPQVQLLVGTSGAVVHEGLKSLQADGIALPVWLAAAGNDAGGAFGDQSARWTSPMTNAALQHSARNIIVVESDSLAGNVVAGETTRSSFSNVGGHLSAPGSAIMSTSTTPAYEKKSGTSMASPHVAGLVGYLYVLEPGLPSPTLDANPVLDLLLENAVPANGGARPRIDAFASAMDVDRVLGGNSVLRKLIDVDDGTPDGNQRTNANGSDFTTDAHGDGKVSMADFRRWRDWALQIHEPQAQSLDGSDNHEKKDINGDGLIELGAPEDIYTRGDFNGDGELTIDTTTRFVPGAIGSRVTDLEVLQELFTDPDYDKSELPDLIRSGDVHMDATTCLTVSGAVSVRSTIRLQGGTTLVRPERNHGGASPLQIYTVPVSGAPGTLYRIRMEAVDAIGGVLQSAQTDTLLRMGQDIRLKPACAPVVTVVVTPASVVLKPGQMQQFTATVSGSANTAVTWSATGGAITQSGLFTAGQNSGTYQVTATSDADTSRQGSAAVTIRTATIQVDSIHGQVVVFAMPNSGIRCDSLRVAPGNVRSDSDSVECSASNTGTRASTATALARRALRIEPTAGGPVSSIQLSVRAESTADTQSGGLVDGSAAAVQAVCFNVSVANTGFAATGSLLAQPTDNANQGAGRATVILYKMNSARRAESFVILAEVGDAGFSGANPNVAAVNQTGTLTPALYCLDLSATGAAHVDGTLFSDRASGSAELTLTFSP